MPNRKSFLIGFGVLCCTAFFSCKTTQKADPNFLGDFEPRLLTETMLNTLPQNGNKLTPREVKFVFYPNNNRVEIVYRGGLNSADILMMQEDREAMIAGMQRYLDEYKANQLGEKNDRKKGYFGTTAMDFSWGLLAPTYTAKNTKFRFEYQLVEKDKPYFVLANISTTETTTNGTTISDGANSPANRLAFSPIQCTEMIKILDQKYLVGIVEDLKTEANAFDLPEDTTEETTQTDVPPKELF